MHKLGQRFFFFCFVSLKESKAAVEADTGIQMKNKMFPL